MAGVDLKNVTKKFGANTVIDNCNLTVNDKEFLVLVGPSGCGKSTLLRIVAGLEEATLGEVFIEGKEVSHLPPKDRDIAMVFQNYALYPHMSVFKNMAFGLRMRKYPQKKIKQRVTEVAEILEIEDLLKRKPAQLSGGQRQRVAMGRAIVRKPAVFLFDEPLSNLDAKLRVQMRLEIKKLHEKLKTTIIYVTHDQVEAMTLADRIAVIKDGVILQHAPPCEIYDNPANKFVAEFIGSPPMNFITVKPAMFENSLGLVAEKINIPLPKDLMPLLSKQMGEKVLVGVRPEHFTLSPSTKNAFAFETEVDVIEPLGSFTVLICKLGETQIFALVSSENAFKSKQKLTLFLDTGRIKLFDIETGISLF